MIPLLITTYFFGFSGFGKIITGAFVAGGKSLRSQVNASTVH